MFFRVLGKGRHYMSKFKRTLALAMMLALGGASLVVLPGCGGSAPAAQEETVDEPKTDTTEDKTSDGDALDPEAMSDLLDETMGAEAYASIEEEAEDVPLEGTNWVFSDVYTPESFDEFKLEAEKAMGTEYVDKLESQVDELASKMNGADVSISADTLTISFSSTGASADVSYTPTNQPGLYQLSSSGESSKESLASLYSTCGVVGGDLYLFPGAGGGYALRFSAA